MKQTSLLVAIIVALGAGIFWGASRPAYAAKLFVDWTAPTQNTDNTPLTDLAGFRIEWGSCATGGAFGIYQAGINVGATTTRTVIYPTNLNPVCVRVYAINSKQTLSLPAYASGPTPAVLSKPTPLSAPVVLSKPTH